MRFGTIPAMQCTGSHRGRTQCMSVSATSVQTSQVHQELGTNGRPAANERVCAAHASWAARVSGAGMDGEAVGGAGVMAELSPVPLEQRRGPWSDCRQSAGADARAGAHPAFRFCNAFVRGRNGCRRLQVRSQSAHVAPHRQFESPR